MTDMTPVKFVAHDASGNITRTGVTPRYALAAQQFDAAGVVEGEGGEATHYVANGAIVAKAPSPITMSGNTFTNVPTDAWAFFEGARYDITDGSALFVFDFPGSYPMTIHSTRFLDFTGTVTQ